MENWMEELFRKLDNKLESECKRLGDRLPYITADGKYRVDYGERDIYWGINGFLAGIMGPMYHAIGIEM